MGLGQKVSASVPFEKIERHGFEEHFDWVIQRFVIMEVTKSNRGLAEQTYH